MKTGSLSYIMNNFGSNNGSNVPMVINLKFIVNSNKSTPFQQHQLHIGARAMKSLYGKVDIRDIKN